MKRPLVALGAIGLTTAAVWWAVTRLPRLSTEAAGADSAAATQATSQQPVAPLRLVPAPPEADTPRGPAGSATGTALMDRLPRLGGSCGAHCGTDRWTVKTLSDSDRDLVDLVPVGATVEELVALERPVERPAFGRAPPAETTIYRVRGYLASWSNQADGDVHVVLFGLGNQRVSMVTEIPNPSCSGVCASGLGGLYAQARLTLDSILFRPNPEGRPIVLEVTGVGFWDRREHASGSAANGIEIHPVLRLREVSSP